MADKSLKLISKRHLITGIIIFWLSLGFAHFMLPVLEDRMIGERDPNIGLILIFNMGWLIWGLATPLMIYIAKKLPVLSGKSIFLNTIKHLLIGVFLVVLLFVIEYSIEVFLAKKIYHLNRDINHFFYSFLYKIHTYIVLYFLIVFGVQSIEYMKNYKNSVEKNAQIQSLLLKAQLQSLKSQIQPHFLFNTHNTIMSLILKGENEKAAGMITELSTLLRSSLDYAEDEFTTVLKEINIVTCYLNIHKIRFEDRLSIIYNIDPGAELLSIPSFLLQPLVENAIVHGIAPYKKNGLIEINVHTDQQVLTVEVRDNGENEVQQKKEGIGISNTRKRLLALFGDNNFVFELRSEARKGSISFVQFPAIPFKFAYDK